jgi:hypothetical protein
MINPYAVLGVLATLASPAAFAGFTYTEATRRSLAGPGAAPATAAVLVESNTEMTSFSQATVDVSKFDVPPGYKQVDAKIAN